MGTYNPFSGVYSGIKTRTILPTQNVELGPLGYVPLGLIKTDMKGYNNVLQEAIRMTPDAGGAISLNTLMVNFTAAAVTGRVRIVDGGGNGVVLFDRSMTNSQSGEGWFIIGHGGYQAAASPNPLISWSELVVYTSFNCDWFRMYLNYHYHKIQVID